MCYALYLHLFYCCVVMLQDDCLPIMCTAPLEYKNGTCLSMFDDIMGLRFRLVFKWDFVGVWDAESVGYSCPLYLHTIQDEILQFFPQLKIAEEYLYLKVSGPRNPIKTIHNGFFRQEANYLIGIFDVNFPYEIRYEQTIRSLMNMILIINVSTSDRAMMVKGKVEGWNYKTKTVGGQTIHADPEDGSVLSMCAVGMFDFLHDARQVIPQLSRMLICPFIDIPLTEYTLFFKGSHICFSDLDEKCISSTNYTLTNGSLSICQDTYIALTFGARNRSNSHEMFISAEWVLSVVCSLASILSLFMTSLTYVIFEPLRTPAGVNTLALSISLLFAFLLTLIRSFEIPSGIVCVSFGVLLHATWLNAFCWMAICSGRISYVLISMRINNNQKTRLCSATFKYILLSFLFSAAFVVFNITSRLVATEMTDMGYSNQTCYISTSENIRYTVDLPLGIVILNNAVLFLIVVIKLQRMPNIQKNVQNERNNLVIFLKISTLTGITWVFGFLYPLTGIVVFSYLFTIFGALQGVFIMVSFVLNKRVLSLYKSICIWKQCKRGDSCVKSPSAHKTANDKCH